MTEAQLDLVERCQCVLGHTFADSGLLLLALTHSSLSDSRLESNERLEFLGDAVLGLIVCEQIYRLFPDALEGQMTKIKSTAVSRRTCAEMAERLGLCSLIQVGKGMESHDALPPSLSAAVVESVIGALYIDAGLDACKAFLLPLIEPLIHEAERSGHQRNFKSVLQQHAQQALDASPQYRVLDEKGPDHAKAFKVAVEIAGVRYEAAWGQSKKQAEQAAALHALCALGVIQTDGDGRHHLVDDPAK
jgi:ribonuclease III, bacterial